MYSECGLAFVAVTSVAEEGTQEMEVRIYNPKGEVPH